MSARTRGVSTLSFRNSVISAISSNNYHDKEMYVEISTGNFKDLKSTSSLRSLKQTQSLRSARKAIENSQESFKLNVSPNI